MKINHSLKRKYFSKKRVLFKLLHYNFDMNLHNYKNSKIALFGKPRAFEFAELHAILQRFDIELVAGYESDATLIVEGAVMPTPLQIKAEELYEKGDVDFISIDAFEKAAAKAIEPKKVLMHLKLAANQEKIIAYLQNDYIDDTLFLDILKLYRFGGENFFENDTNRDITAALIRRFYKEYEKNHNIQYSYIGLLGVIEQSGDTKLLETIFNLEPVQKALQNQNDPNAKLLELFALHPASSSKILHTLIKSRHDYLIQTVAAREKIEDSIQETLLERNDPQIDTALASAKELAPSTIKTLVKRGYAEKLAASLQLDQERFELLRAQPSIALNETLTPQMQKQLFADTKYREFLAQNPACTLTRELLDLQDDTIRALVYRYHDISDVELSTDGFEAELAANATTPKTVLEAIYTKNIHEANAALAANPSTPVDILYQLSFDMRYAKTVKSNPAFGQHIKTLHAIGI